ncbi:S1C family serine protease [Halosimplex salinum]|uniref:S1C family serine protease n=1 Tax=Halosimplex salinum TaxID=1710538 RepID=UPI001F389C29|nr:trypsin-like peptidase domain-containing protein [Halosimplex salinum]
MQRTTAAVFVTALLLIGSVGGVMALAIPDGDPAQQSNQQQAACDYEALFDRTIDSVVSVRTTTGQGSGFVYDAADASGVNQTGDTHIVTNAHVIRDAATVEVQFDENEFRTGTVVGRSTYADLAVVNVSDAPENAEGLSVADSDPDRGEKVAALGNPLGLEETITHGIVSGVNRSLPTQRGFEIPNVVQTDAPISPGNSGGPLVTCDGTVVGVNTAGIAQQGAENIGFAVSASVIERVAPALATNGSFDYPYLGISSRPVTPAVAEANDLDRTEGVVVVSTVDDGPASGVLRGATGYGNASGQIVPVGGDVIRTIDGTTVTTSEDLATYLVTETRPGETVEMTVLRDGQERTVNATVGERPAPGTS